MSQILKQTVKHPHILLSSSLKIKERKLASILTEVLLTRLSYQNRAYQK